MDSNARAGAGAGADAGAGARAGAGAGAAGVLEMCILLAVNYLLRHGGNNAPREDEGTPRIALVSVFDQSACCTKPCSKPVSAEVK